MNRKTVPIRISFRIAAFVVFLLLVVFQQVKINRLENLSDTQNAELNILKSQISAELNILKSQMGDIDHQQEATEAKTRNLSLLAARHSHSFVGPNAGAGLQTLEIGEGAEPSGGSFNTAVGYDALGANRTGVLNAAIGTEALSSNDAGSNNLAAGANALGSNKSGDGNVAVGSAAMYRNVSGAHNSALGLQALYHLEDGRNNSAFGRDSLFSVKKGSWNSAYGVDSLPGLEVGEGNSAFGGEAGYTDNRDNQHRLGSFNSWFGYRSGPATLKQVSNSIAIGYEAKNTDSNQTVIGNKDTAETIIHGALKISILCIGSACADATSFEALLKGTKQHR